MLKYPFQFLPCYQIALHYPFCDPSSHRTFLFSSCALFQYSSLSLFHFYTSETPSNQQYYSLILESCRPLLKNHDSTLSVFLHIVENLCNLLASQVCLHLERYSSV